MWVLFDSVWVSENTKLIVRQVVHSWVCKLSLIEILDGDNKFVVCAVHQRLSMLTSAVHVYHFEQARYGCYWGSFGPPTVTTLTSHE